MYTAFPRFPRRGTVLVLVLIVSVVLALAVFSFARLMVSERRGSYYGMRHKQARNLAESGVEWLRLFLSQDELTIQDRGDLYDNPNEFCGVVVLDGSVSGFGIFSEGRSAGDFDPRDVGRFTIISPRLSDDGSLIGEDARYGLEDESAKINLHWIMQIETEYPGMGRVILMRLPGVDEAIADAILDWMDEDDQPRQYGAEYDYYELLDPPYYPKNAVPDSVDELMLVDGVTPQLLYGIDWNRNGIRDFGEPDPVTLEEAFEVYDESLNLGLAAYLTVDSRESQLTPDGLSLKVNVNSEDVDALRENLLEVLEDQQWVDYIVAYRQYGPAESSGQSESDAGDGGSDGANDGANDGGESPQRPDAQQSGQQGSPQDSGQDAGQSGGTTSVATAPANGENELPEIKSLLDFVGGSVETDAGETLSSPFSEEISEMRQYLPILYDYLTTGGEPMIGRINLNQTPRTVLEVLSTRFDDSEEVMQILADSMGLDPSALDMFGGGGETADASGSSDPDSSTTTASTILELLGIPADEVDPLIEGILENRIVDPFEAAQDEPDMLYPYWPYTLGITENLETIKKLEPYFCTRGSVYRAQVVGRYDAVSPAVRLEVWIDCSVRPAKILRIRELSELGPGYPPEMLGIDEQEYFR